MARRVNMHLDEEFAAQIEAQKPKSLALAAFCALLIEQALDTSCTLTERATADPRTSGDAIASGVSKAVGFLEEELNQQPLLEAKKTKPKKEKDAFSARVVSPDLIPADLLDCQQLLPEWWTVKKGVRSEGVWNRVCGKLRGWSPELRREALERAIASGWGDVFEPKAATPTQRQQVGQKSIDELGAEMAAMPSLW